MEQVLRLPAAVEEKKTNPRKAKNITISDINGKLFQIATCMPRELVLFLRFLLLFLLDLISFVGL